jgi:predicted membrane-bound spermidine synthase
MTAFLYIIFILSGAAGLIYESIWTRYLGLFVGHSAYAQIIVLVIFLGGMSLGAILVGRRSERLREPLKWYALVEMVVGIIGLVFHDVFVSVTSIAYDSILPGLPGVTLIIVKWSIAALLILPQSILLGATFPLMSAGVLRMAGQVPGRALSLLYFANSLGAAGGVLLAGFYLISIAGLPGTLIVAAGINLVVGLAVLSANRLWLTVPAHTVPPAPRAHSSGAVPIIATRDPLLKLLLAVSFGTALASFVYEIAWIRMLSLVLGSATHSFELMLSAFILGLALGSFWIRTRADRIADPVRVLGIVQWLMGTLAIATLPLYLASFSWTVQSFQTFGLTEAGYLGFTVSRYAICLAVMLPATFCAGITLPLITRTLVTSATGERAIGLVYGVNTLGSIVGAGLAGLVMLPLLGVKTTLVIGALIDMTLGVALLARSRGRWMTTSRLAPALALASVVIIIAATAGARFDRTLLSGAVYRLRAMPVAGANDITFYRDGRTATVSAGHNIASGSRFISTNGKPDASVSGDWMFPERRAKVPRPVGGDESTQILSALLPLAYQPNAKHAVVIGQGSGMTSHLMLSSPTIEELVTIDIEPEMIEGSRVFYPTNRRVFDDPRSKFVIDDAKSYFSAAHRKFDIILSEPSNPWVSGVSGLFTTEFYTRLKTYMTDDGVFGQWLHLYEINDQLVLNVLAALHANFPAYEVYLVSEYDLLVVATKASSLPKPDWTVFDFPRLTADIPHLVKIDRDVVERLHLANRESLAPLLDRHIAPNSDFYPVLDLGTERTRYLRERADGFAKLHSQRFDIVSAMTGRTVPFGTNQRVAVDRIPRLRNAAYGRRLVAERGGGRDSMPHSAALDSMRFRQNSLASFYASKKAPSDWRSFTWMALQAERDLHDGTAGVADETFYRPLFEYLRVAKAPSQAIAAVQFAHALSVWDFTAASEAGDTLMKGVETRMLWVPVEFLRDGLVIAKLRRGDPLGARKVYHTLTDYYPVGIPALRSLLVESYLRAAEQASSTAEGPRPRLDMPGAGGPTAAVPGAVSVMSRPSPLVPQKETRRKP